MFFGCIVFSPSRLLCSLNLRDVGGAEFAFAGLSRFNRFGCLDSLDRCWGFDWGLSFASEEGSKFIFQSRDFLFEIGGVT